MLSSVRLVDHGRPANDGRGVWKHRRSSGTPLTFGKSALDVSNLRSRPSQPPTERLRTLWCSAGSERANLARGVEVRITDEELSKATDTTIETERVRVFVHPPCLPGSIFRREASRSLDPTTAMAFVTSGLWALWPMPERC